MNPKWFSVVGLLLDAAGAMALAAGLFISKAGAVELSVARRAADDVEGNLSQPQVQDRLRQSRNAVIGVILLALGFILQIVGSWPR